MKCTKCGKEIEEVKCLAYDSRGYEIEEEYSLKKHNDNCYSFVTGNEFFPGYELEGEELKECIHCPVCGEYPFNDEQLDVYEQLEVVCFKK